MIKIREEIHQQLVDYLLKKELKHLIKPLEDVLLREMFEEEMMHLIEGNTFKTQDIFQLFYGCFQVITDNFKDFATLENIEEYTYLYALKLSYPTTLVKNISPEKDEIALIALNILRIFFELQKEVDKEMWVSKYALDLLEDDEVQDLSDDEYSRFKTYVKDEYVYEMMKMNQDIMGYSTLDHICGVHHLAVKIGRQLKHLKLPIDLGRVSGAAYGHDIGKYGCKPEEARKVAYYHYYYTAEWFTERNIVYIRNVAFNHSTWDLELANLSLESLVLIYCDFRVKANEDKTSMYPMHFYSLDEAFDVILNKLDNVDVQKERRYRRVYNRLKDFEDYMISKGVNLDPDCLQDIQEGHEDLRKHFSILQGKAVVENAKFQAISHNIGIMHRLRDENSLNTMLESAKGLNNIDSLRSYQYILEEYSEYLTQKQKMIVLKFLYDRLMLPAEDIRKQTAKLIGVLISKFDEIERKELPKDARKKVAETDSVNLFKTYLEKFFYPNLRIIDKHKEWIRLGMSSMVKSLLNHSPDHKNVMFMNVLLSFCEDPMIMTDLAPYMLEAIRVLPLDRIDDDQIIKVIEFVNQVAKSENTNLRVHCYDVFCEMIPKIKPVDIKYIQAVFPSSCRDDITTAETYARYKLLDVLGFDTEEKECYRLKCISMVAGQSDVYLSNLKSATSWIAKKLQIQLLLNFVIKFNKEDSFYLAMHLCNLLKVSSHESVRNVAGRGLVELSDYLSKGQNNDIVVELLRALEMENYQYTKYICSYLGVLLTKLEQREVNEIVESFKEKIERANPQICMLVLLTTGVVIENLHQYDLDEKQFYDMREKLLGILLKGFVNDDTKVNQTAVSVIGKNLFNSSLIPMSGKANLLRKMLKKILSLMVNTDDSVELVYLNNAAGLNHIYNFISDYAFEEGEFELEEFKKIAFFPGAFDPFSLSHKEIARQIRNLGFEVYLSVDEFSWSKKTQPNLIRRDIMKMSIADEFNLYVFPRDISVNIANTEDLERLAKTYDKADVHIVIGSDVILNASAYKKEAETYSIHNFSHVIFERHAQIYSNYEKIKLEENVLTLNKEVVRLVLPQQFEQISSTQIRNYIDENRDISDLIDPLAQKYIYERGLYQREPQFKEMVTTKSVHIEVVHHIDDPLKEELLKAYSDGDKPDPEAFEHLLERRKPRAIILRSIGNDNEIIAFSIFHWLRSSSVYEEFEVENVAKYLIENSVGRLLVIDALEVNKAFNFSDPEQMILTETLAFCLAKDYSYSVISPFKGTSLSDRFQELVKLHGYTIINEDISGRKLYAVEMTSPCTLNLDARTLLKEPLRSNDNVIQAISDARKRLQQAIADLYPGELVLSFDRTMLYENLIKKITEKNGVPATPTHPRKLGDAMCVPFGAIFKRWILPNTVTKSLHTERFFSPDLTNYDIEAYPYYLDIENQVKRIQSFSRPVILVDDLLNKGYRISAIKPVLDTEEVEIDQVIVGIMSGQGKALLERQDIKVDSAYFIPRLKVWFNESLLYPFLGGDTLWRGKIPTRNIIPSINQILPYTSPNYIRGSSMQAIYKFSEVCLENAMNILRVLEDEYLYLHENSLTLSHLGEVMMSPRLPDRGEKISYDMSQKASDYLENDLEQLRRLKKYIANDN